jgi:hypothetical protein
LKKLLLLILLLSIQSAGASDLNSFWFENAIGISPISTNIVIDDVYRTNSTAIKFGMSINPPKPLEDVGLSKFIRTFMPDTDEIVKYKPNFKKFEWSRGGFRTTRFGNALVERSSTDELIYNFRIGENTMLHLPHIEITQPRTKGVDLIIAVAVKKSF